MKKTRSLPDHNFHYNGIWRAKSYGLKDITTRVGEAKGSRLKGGGAGRGPVERAFASLVNCMFCFLILGMLLVITALFMLVIPIAARLATLLLWGLFTPGAVLLFCACCLACSAVGSVPMDDLPNSTKPRRFPMFMDDIKPDFFGRSSANRRHDDASISDVEAPREMGLTGCKWSRASMNITNIVEESGNHHRSKRNQWAKKRARSVPDKWSHRGETKSTEWVQKGHWTSEIPPMNQIRIK